MIYVTGGRQAAPVTSGAAAEGYEARYDMAVIGAIDTESHQARRVLEYETPLPYRPDANPSILFKAGSLSSSGIDVVTQTEVLSYSVPDFTLVGRISKPYFNDLHHVRRAADRSLIVVVTGLDLAVQITPDGELLREWNVGDIATWTRFSKQSDYRKIWTTKPHHAHPNYAFELDGEPWITRFEQRDAICLDKPTRRVEVGGERIHDGVVHGDHIFFTGVDGRVIVVNRHTLAIDEIINLTNTYPPGTLIGWTRGIAVDNRGFWIGFTRMRYTRFRENVEWVARGLKASLPSRVDRFEFGHNSRSASVNLEPIGLNAIFGLLLTAE